MSAFDLNGKMSLDGSGFSRTLQKKKVEANKFSQEVRNQFKAVGVGFLSGAFGAAIGFGAITSLFRSMVEDTQKIKGLSDELMVSSQEAAGLVDMADRAGMSVSELTDNGAKLEEVLKRVRAGGTIPDMVTDEQIEKASILGGWMSQIGSQIKNSASTLVGGFLNLSNDKGPRNKRLGNAIIDSTLQFFGAEKQPKFDEAASKMAAIRRRAAQQAKEEAEASKIRAQKEQDQAKEINALESDTAKRNERNRVSRLSDMERLLEIQKELHKLASPGFGGALQNALNDNRISVLAGEEAQLKQRLDQTKAVKEADIQRERLNELKSKRADIDGRIGAQQSGVDSLTRAGGFTSGQSAKDRQITELMRIRAELKEIKVATKGTERGVNQEVGI